jgi:glycerol-3-phosphate O-acyltransferase
MNKLNQVQPEEEWSILKLSNRRQEIIDEVIRKSIQKINADTEDAKMTLEDQIAKTMYLERIRMKEEPWSIDPADENSFWKSIKKGLIRNEKHFGDGKQLEVENRNLLHQIIARYAHEISGYFQPKMFNFARTAVPLILSRLLNGVNLRSFLAFFNPTINLRDKLRISGEIDSIRSLVNKGTVVLLPTHSSNLDSPLIGWALDAVGLPPFIYGAGLNLFNSRIVGFFMNRLGAYKVDRRKKNHVYNETLKIYSQVAIRNGCHSLFFPGGTRSRSGALEGRLKLGLMGTAVEAQRMNYLEFPNSDKAKIYVVPLVLSYHFVLEAESLIRQHLDNVGQDKFFISDESSSYLQIVKFLWKFFSKNSELELSFGKPMDIFGNFVDDEGNSFDKAGRIVDTRAYFLSRGEVTNDAQRDAEYTRILGEKVTERYLAENVVFSSHIIAFVGFELLRKKYNPIIDLYSFLRIPDDDRGIELADMLASTERVMNALREMESKGKVRLATHLQQDTLGIVKHALRNLGLYNERRPLFFAEENLIESQSLSLLHFYANRLSKVYGLEKFV